MVMQSVRSRCNTAVLPYVMYDLKKIESPIKIESPKLLRQLRDRTFSGEASPTSASTQMRSSPPTSPRKSILLHAEKSGVSSSSQMLFLVSVLVGTILVGSILTNEALSQKVTAMELLREELADTQLSINAQLQRNRRRYESVGIHDSNIASPTDQVVALTADVQRLKETLAEERKKSSQTKQDMELLKERVREAEYASVQQQQSLRSALKGVAKRQVEYEFGPGPHYAQFTLNIMGEGIRQFIVEFASVEFMPVTLNLFLHQIQRGLWDDSAFYLKGAHVLVARPLSWDLKRSKREFFGELLHLPFPEYSDKVPNTKYTLGLNGHSSGPDFHINLVDNTVHRGPQGLQSNISGDPCFATVILGRETVDLLEQLPARGDNLLLENAVQIVQVRIIEELEEVHGGREYMENMQAPTSVNPL